MQFPSCTSLLPVMMLILALGLAYLAGSIPTGLWMGQYFLGVDLRQHGSGNMGATNAFRVLGKKMGAIVLLLDMLKGLLPVLFLGRLLGANLTEEKLLLIGLAAVAGHVFSVFVNFKGGKGVATALGVFLGLVPWQMLSVLGLGIAIIVVTGYVSLASITGAILLPVLVWYSGKSGLVLGVTCAVCLMVLVRHRSNIQRLLAGTERRLTDKSPKEESPADSSIDPEAVNDVQERY